MNTVYNDLIDSPVETDEEADLLINLLKNEGLYRSNFRRAELDHTEDSDVDQNVISFSSENEVPFKMAAAKDSKAIFDKKRHIFEEDKIEIMTFGQLGAEKDPRKDKLYFKIVRDDNKYLKNASIIIEGIKHKLEEGYLKSSIYSGIVITILSEDEKTWSITV